MSSRSILRLASMCLTGVLLGACGNVKNDDSASERSDESSADGNVAVCTCIVGLDNDGNDIDDFFPVFSEVREECVDPDDDVDALAEEHCAESWLATDDDLDNTYVCDCDCVVHEEGCLL